MALPDPDLAVELSVDRLALELLRLLAGPGPHGRDNITGLQVQAYYRPIAGRPLPRVDNHRYEQAMSEAFDWLLAERLIARDASQSSDDWVKRTARGDEVAASRDGMRPLEVDRLLAIELHPSLRDRRVREKFASGEIEEAVWAAVKQVEVGVRDAAGAEKGQLGTKLMAFAFSPGEGPLHDPDLERGEQAGVMALYQGLIGAFKNPNSHRHVDFDDPVQAAEIVLFADLLLRMLDRNRAGDK